MRENLIEISWYNVDFLDRRINLEKQKGWHMRQPITKRFVIKPVLG
jgi:hypothetical protein